MNRDWIEARLRLLAGLFHDRSRTTLVLLALVVLVLGSGLLRVRIDTSTKGLLRDGDPTLTAYEEFADQFGRDDLIVVGVESDHIFTPEFLEKLRALHEDLAENVPLVTEVTSLINARDTRGQGDRLIVEGFLDNLPQDPAQLARVRERALANPLYRNLYLSREGRLTAILIGLEVYSQIGADKAGSGEEALSGFGEENQPAGPKPPKPEFLTEEENRLAVTAIREIMNRHRSPDFQPILAGARVVSETLKRIMLRDIYVFLGLSLAVMALVLLVMFRRLAGVVLPLLVVALGLVSTLGLMGHCDEPVKIPNMILPSFLLAVGLGGAIHVLALFFRRYDQGADKREAIVWAVGHSGMAVIMAALTTSAGLASFLTAEIAPIASLGLFAGLGVLLALVYSLILLPALISLLPLARHRGEKGDRPGARFDLLLDRIAGLATARAGLITLIGLILVGFSLAGMARIRFSHDVLAWLGQGVEVRQATEKLDRDLRGTVVLELVLDTGRENGLHQPEILKSLDALAAELEAARWGDLFVGKAASLVLVLKEINQALNEDRPEFYAVPDQAALIAQEFLLFENTGSDDLDQVVDQGFRKARLSIKVPWRDTLEYVPFLEDIEARVERTFGGRVETTVTGMMTLFARTFNAAMRSALKSYVVALVVITVLMILLIGNLRLGFLSMLPNLTPILITAGLMGWLSLPFDMSTMLVFSVAIGLAVDDTIHFMHNYRRYRDQTGEAGEAIRLTLRTAGRAMLVTSVVLSLGFFIFMLASIVCVFYFGLLTGVAVILALLADFLMAPALLTLVDRRRGGQGG